VKNIRRWTTIKKLDVNESIRDREVRLIDSNGEQIGIMSSKKALEIAAEKKLDLVKIAPKAKPPVCKIMDYGKYKYEQAKKEKEAKKKQKTITLKEVRLSLKIEDHDLNTKARNAIKFLENGDKVKVSLRFKGRELGHTELGVEVLNKFYSIVEEVGVMEKKPKMEGRSMVMFLAPKN
jgi:translation initiation factor IF-3